MDKHLLSVNSGGVENWAFYDDDTRSLYCMDVQRGHVNQRILDANEDWRKAERLGDLPKRQGRHIARIPITIWTNWRREWMSMYRDMMHWQTFELIRLHDPANKKFLTTERPFPDHYIRDEGKVSLGMPHPL